MGDEKASAGSRLCLSVLVGLAFVAGSASAERGGRSISPKVAKDLNPDPEVVEVVLTAAEREVRLGPGKRVEMWTYNEGTPGPTIEGKVGDTLIVHFHNDLPESTTIHWHGVEVPANMDGSNISQGAVPPGGYFRYEFKLLRAATYWYHPHIDSDEQVERGLYGALIVRDPAQDGLLGLPAREQVLVLDDVLLERLRSRGDDDDDDGDSRARDDDDDDEGPRVGYRIAPPLPEDPLARALMLANGREGNTLLVNGRLANKRQNRGLRVRRGEPLRLRVINAANSRFMRLSIPGHRMFRIGGDGGLLEEPIEVPPIEMVPDPDDPGRLISNPDPGQGVLLTPAERADIILTPTGRHPIKVELHDFPRGRHSTSFNEAGGVVLGDDENDGKSPPRTLLTLRPFGAARGEAEYLPPAALAEIEPIDTAGAETIKVEFGHTQPNPSGDITFFIQRKANTGQCPLPPGVPCPLPFRAVTPADAPSVKVGDIRVIEVNNLTAGIHNFHLHGFFFQPIETRFIDMDDPDNNYVVPAAHRELKDTVALPARPGAIMRSRSITRLAVVFDDSGREGLTEAFGKVPGEDISGGWLMHCHVLEHGDGGMMSFVQVRNALAGLSPAEP